MPRGRPQKTDASATRSGFAHPGTASSIINKPALNNPLIATFILDAKHSAREIVPWSPPFWIGPIDAMSASRRTFGADSDRTSGTAECDAAWYYSNVNANCRCA